MTAAQKQRVIDQLASEIAQQYVELDRISEINAALGTLASDPALAAPLSPAQAAELLTRELSRYDEHFAVRWRAADGNQPSAAGESWFSSLDRQNSGFKRIEILDGNIGYIDFWGFDEVNDRSTARVAAIMASVADTDALIFDLRNNGGGSGDMVRLISSYLLAGGIHLNSIYWRPNDSTTETWTLAEVPGVRRLEVPVYVLISNDTFSAAEEFAYNLKHLTRATLVGEPTKGGANPWKFFELGDGFRAAIPIAKAINPVTLSNWEHVGVQPDVPTLRAAALKVAYRAALSRLQGTTRDERKLDDIERALSLAVPESPNTP